MKNMMSPLAANTSRIMRLKSVHKNPLVKFSFSHESAGHIKNPTTFKVNVKKLYLPSAASKCFTSVEFTEEMKSFVCFCLKLMTNTDLSHMIS